MIPQKAIHETYFRVQAKYFVDGRIFYTYVKVQIHKTCSIFNVCYAICHCDVVLLFRK